MSPDRNDILLVVAKSTSSNLATSPSITIYYKPIPLSNTFKAYDEITYRQKDPLLGPFHPSLGPVPPEATISRQIHSSMLQNLLQKLSILPAEFLEVPTSTKLPRCEYFIDAFRNRWPYVFYDIYRPAKQIWLERVFRPLPIDYYSLEKWYKRPVSSDLSDNALEEWDETAMYGQIMRILMECHESWECFTHGWLNDPEYRNYHQYFEERKNKVISNTFDLDIDLIDSSYPGPETIEETKIRRKRYFLWPPFNGYFLPTTPFIPTPLPLPPQSFEPPESTLSTIFSWIKTNTNSSTTTSKTSTSALESISAFPSSSSPSSSTRGNNSSSSNSTSPPRSINSSPSASPPSKLSGVKEIIFDGIETKLEGLDLLGVSELEGITQEEEEQEREPLIPVDTIRSNLESSGIQTLVRRKKFNFHTKEK